MPAKSECVSALLRASNRKDITEADAARILEEIENLAEQKRASRKMNRREALEAASKEWIDETNLHNMVEKRNTLLQFAAGRDLLDRIKSFKRAHDAVVTRLKHTTGEGLFKTTERGVESGQQSVEVESDAIASYEGGRMVMALESEGVMRDFQKGQIDELIYIELEQLTIEGGKPGITGNASAKKIAAAVHPVLDSLVDQKNRWGAWIKKLPGYTVKQTHDKKLIRDLGGKNYDAPGHREASYQEWKRIILPLLNRERTFGIKKPDKFLRQVHENLYAGEFKRTQIVKDGEEITDIIGLRPEINTLSGSKAKSVSASRVLHFKDARSSYDYAKQLGIHTRLYDAVRAQINSDANSVALMRAFGPNAEAGFRKMVDEAKAIAKTRGVEIDDFTHQSGVKKIEDAWKSASGQLNNPVEKPLGRFADILLTIQSVSKLFGATITSIGDVAFVWHAMRQMGVGRIDAGLRVMGSLPKGFEAFRPFAREGNEAAMFYRMNAVASDAISGEVMSRMGTLVSQGGRSGEWLRTANEGFFRWNFLTQWTESVKAAAFHAHASLLGEMAHLRMPDLPIEVSTPLREVGITDLQWDLIRQGARDIDGNRFLGADALDDIDVSPMLKEKGLKDTATNRKKLKDDLRIKTIAYFRSFQDRAVPSPGAHERIIQTAGGTSKDTPYGAVNALFWQFKTFPITVYNKVIRGNKGMAEFYQKNGSYWFDVAILVAATTITGYLSGMFKDALKGRGPKPLDRGKTWMDAALRGGAMGIYGDMLFQQYDKGRRDFISTFAGPTAGSIVNPGIATAQQLLAAPFADDPGDQFKKAAKGTLDILGSNVPKPGASYLLIKPIFDYTVGFAINEFFQPGWERRYKQRMKENGQELFLHGDPDNNQ